MTFRIGSRQDIHILLRPISDETTSIETKLMLRSVVWFRQYILLSCVRLDGQIWTEG